MIPRAYNWQMLFDRPIPAALLSAFMLVSFGCGAGPANSTNSNVASVSKATNRNSNVARTNVEELSLQIRIPYEVEDVVWKEDTAKETLLAVLRFSSADSEKIVSEAIQFGTPQPNVVSPEVWFPEELIAQSEMTGDNALKGQAYPANGFLQESYTSGKVTRIDGTDFFVLEAHSK
ncbi:MAG: hypothetical protein IPG58_10155 [Acidobacteria bacterium]|nr:hypothetical protein [Acidobacteriota bacterium]MBP7475371.1 hypothetical protein [Pyrinomonadaceae bacterium]